MINEKTKTENKGAFPFSYYITVTTNSHAVEFLLTFKEKQG